jgi:Uncharacterised nucleotidyltransferase
MGEAGHPKARARGSGRDVHPERSAVLCEPDLLREHRIREAGSVRSAGGLTSSVSARARGAMVAAAVRGGWRENPPPPTLPIDELTEITPLLLDAGCGALGWWCVRGSSIAATPAAEQLRDAYRLHTLQAAVHERDLAEVVRALSAAGIEPLIIKGWTAARFYAEPGLRPYGDIDVCVAPEQLTAARAPLANVGPAVDVDLHGGLNVNRRALPDLPSFEEARARAVRVRLEDVEVPILAPEDHITLLCVHLLSHGVSRPVWLCDVAAALERLPGDFDWERCLNRTPRLASWVAATVILAQRLLGAEAEHLPSGPRPRWLERAVLKEWGSRRRDYPGDLIGLTPARHLRPRHALRVVRANWVNPVSATMFPGATFNSLPRLPFQLRFVAWKAGRFLRLGGS